MFWFRVPLVAAFLVLSSACDRLPIFGEPPEDVELLSEVELAEEVAPPQMLASDTPKTSPFSDLWTRLRGLNPAPDVGDVAPLVDLPFGVLERTCGVSRRELGQNVAAASGFEVYDTQPGSTQMRPHYITGFDDGCARQFSAALVLLGDVGTHEIVRYSRTRVALDYSTTDNAYEEIKARFCRVGEGKPCGDRLDALGKVATFVTAYRSFGAASEWAEFLLYDGQVAAVDLEGL